MKKLALLAALVGGCGGWQHHDTLAQTAVVYSLALDYKQTLDITQDCLETNPIMGPCGERMDPDLYFASVIAIDTVLAFSIPPPWRYIFQSAVLAGQAHTVWHNHRLSK